MKGRRVLCPKAIDRLSNNEPSQNAKKTWDARIQQQLDKSVLTGKGASALLLEGIMLLP